MSKRKLVVDGNEYQYNVKKTGKHERTVSIKSGKIYKFFMFDGNITPRMVKEFISNGFVADGNKIYSAQIDSLLHNTGII